MYPRIVILSLAAALALPAAPAFAKDPTYVGSVQVVRGGAVSDIARGTVFLDADRDSRLDPGEKGIPGVMVSNGREVVVTDADGAYALPAYDDMNLFVTKPAGYATPMNADLVPQFNYVHKVAGSPPLRFGGIAPTGPLPAAVNFPLIEDRVGDRFQCLVFGDTQTYTNRELSYVRDTVGRMLAGRDNAATECLIFEGDVMGDDLSLYGRFRKIVAAGGVPQYYVPGNHDLDFDAADDRHSFDTFRREWGPEYYFLRYRQGAFRGAGRRALSVQRSRRPRVLRPRGETDLQRRDPRAPARMAAQRPGACACGPADRAERPHSLRHLYRRDQAAGAGGQPRGALRDHGRPPRARPQRPHPHRRADPSGRAFPRLAGGHRHRTGALPPDRGPAPSPARGGRATSTTTASRTRPSGSARRAATS